MVDMSPFIEAMAQQVAIRVKAELESSGVVRPRLLNVKQAAVYLGRTRTASGISRAAERSPWCASIAACSSTFTTWTDGFHKINLDLTGSVLAQSKHGQDECQECQVRDGQYLP